MTRDDARRATLRDHGEPECGVYFGRDPRRPIGDGVLVSIARQARAIRLRDTDGNPVDAFGDTAKFWLAPAPSKPAPAAGSAGDRITEDTRALVAHTDDLNPAENMWPRPRLVDGLPVFTFADSCEAYDQTQVRDDIHDGDVLHIPSEKVAGFLLKVWPVAVSAQRGALHSLIDSNDLVIEGTDYRLSARVARSLLGADEPAEPTVPPPSTYGLRDAPHVWTVTISGSERYDGEAHTSGSSTRLIQPSPRPPPSATTASTRNTQTPSSATSTPAPRTPPTHTPTTIYAASPPRRSYSPRRTSAASPKSGWPCDASTGTSPRPTPTRSTPPTRRHPASPSAEPPPSPSARGCSWTNSDTDSDRLAIRTAVPTWYPHQRPG